MKVGEGAKQAIHDQLLAAVARQPCACGRLAKADQQRPASYLRLKERLLQFGAGDTENVVIDVTQRLECLVCHQIHQCGLTVTVTQYFLSQ